MATRDEILSFYESTYDVLGAWTVRPGDKIVLGDKNNRVCRFCGRGAPDVTFKKVAHAIPELLGNKSISTAYECDRCNEGFGKGIENDLGNWSKPMRTMMRIKGKNGVPTLKKQGEEPGWRIELGPTGFAVRSYEDDPVFEIDESQKTVKFMLRRDAYTPVAVLKAFMKIGLTLMPQAELGNFEHLMAWIKDTDHSKLFAEKCPIMYTFIPGPMPHDVLFACILRRKSHDTKFPYAYLVLSYGSEVFQVQLPSQQQDGETANYQIFPFPTPSSTDPRFTGKVGRALLQLEGREVVRGEIMPLTMGFELAQASQPTGAP